MIDNVSAFAHRLCLAERDQKIARRILRFVIDLTIEMLVFEEQNRIVAADRRSQQTVRVERGRRVNDHQTRRVRKQRRARLRVINRTALQITADRNTHHHRAFRVAVRTPARHRDLVADLVIRREDVIEKLYLDDRFQSADRHPDRTADDVCLGERRIENARRAKFSLQIRRHLEHAAFAFDLSRDILHASNRPRPRQRRRCAGRVPSLRACSG